MLGHPQNLCLESFPPSCCFPLVPARRNRGRFEMSGFTMARDKIPYLVRPPTAVLTRGFDPRLSVGSARPAVFRSSTYVFSSPEAAERAFDLASGRAKAEPG